MKTNNLLILGVIAAGAYFLLKKDNAVSATTENMQSGQQLNPTDAYNQIAAQAGVTPSDAIEVLNESATTSTLKRTSSTIARNVSYKTPDGVERVGNIAKLGTGATVAISATPAIKDKQGKTALDRLIDKNKAGKTSSQLARKKNI